MIEEKRIITLNSTKNNTYFFSTDHCQRLKSDITGDNWVPVTSTLPMHIWPRPSLPNGLVDTLEKYIMIFHENEIEIPNPDPKYKPAYR